MYNETQQLEQHLLDFLNLADARGIAEFAEKQGVKIDAKALVQARDRQENKAFSSLDQLRKGEDYIVIEDNIIIMRSAFARREEKIGKVRSHTIFTFAGSPPKLGEFDGGLYWEPTGRANATPSGRAKFLSKEASYFLYYNPSIHKESLFKAIKSSSNFRSEALDRRFAIHVRNGQFVTGYTNSSALLRDMYFATHFAIQHEAPKPHGQISNVPNPDLAVTMGFDWFGQNTRLSWEGPSNRVRMKGNGNTPALDEWFDVNGLFAAPSWSTWDTWESFTMMPYLQMGVSPGNDPREYITAAQPIGSSNGLIGSNHQTGWDRDAQMRYVEVIEDVCLRALNNSSHTGSNSNNMYLMSDWGGAVSTQYVAPNTPTDNFPAGAFFDMYVFHGTFDKRDDIACRIALRSKLNRRFMGTQGAFDESVRTDSNNNHFTPNVLWNVEKGWGNGIWNVFLRSQAGKYLFNWQNVVVADTVEAINMEQWEILVP